MTVHSQRVSAPTSHIIDLDADPYILIGSQVEEHHKGGLFTWDPSKVTLYRSEEQARSGLIEGHKLHEKLKGKSPFNANLLDYLLKNPHLIPDEWKAKYVYFWGTIYRDDSRGSLAVRYLCWIGGRWGRGSGSLAGCWHHNCPAAVSAH